MVYSMLLTSNVRNKFTINITLKTIKQKKSGRPSKQMTEYIKKFMEFIGCIEKKKKEYKKLKPMMEDKFVHLSKYVVNQKCRGRPSKEMKRYVMINNVLHQYSAIYKKLISELNKEEKIKAKKIKVKKNTYISRDKNRANKDRSNENLCKIIVKNKIATNRAIIMDHTDLGTSKMLEQKTDFKFSNIMIPNNRNNFSEIKENIEHYDQDLLEFLCANDNQNSVDVAYFDYCGTFNGNEHDEPKNDMIVLFSKRLLSRKSIFGVTFCLRDKKENVKGRDNKKDKYVNKIAYYGKLNGYKVQHLPKYDNDYGIMTTMFFLCVRKL